MNWKLVLLIILIGVLEAVIYLVSWEIGAGSTVLLMAIGCILFILKKSATVDDDDEAAPFLNTNIPQAPAPNAFVAPQPPPVVPQQVPPFNPVHPTSAVPGVDSSVFAQFRNKLNLETSPQSGNQAVPNVAPNVAMNNVATAYGVPQPAPSPVDTFADELNDTEQVRVTLSKAVQALKDTGQKVEQKTVQHIPLPSAPAAPFQVEKPVPEPVVPNQQLPSPEVPFMDQILNDAPSEPQQVVPEPVTEALQNDMPDYPFKQTAKQPEAYNGPLVEDEDDDLFADALIPLPGGETLTERKMNDVSPNDENESEGEQLDFDEGLGSFLKKPTHHEETAAEAEGLLKIATASCQSGRWDEAKASLDSYIDYLNQIDQKPSPDVIQLYEQLNTPFGASNPQQNESSMENSFQAEPLKKETPSDYASVMKELVSALEEKQAYDEALPLLQDLLNYNRQRVNLREMDLLYGRIQKAYSFLKLNDDLVNSYKEHLAIKQQIQDVPGEVQLLELISQYYAHIGDAEASRRYQTESVRVAGSAGKAAFPVS